MEPKKKRMKWKVGDLIYYRDATFIDYLLIAEVDRIEGRYKIIPIKSERRYSDSNTWRADLDAPHYIYDYTIPGYKLAA